jgi:hypothetical protein
VARVVGHHVKSGAVTSIRVNRTPVDGSACDARLSLDLRDQPPWRVYRSDAAPAL